MSAMKYLQDDNILVLSKPLARALGVGHSILLRRMNYWINFNLEAKKLSTHYRDGHWWCYNTYQEWEKDIAIYSDESCKRILTELEDLGIVVSSQSYNSHPMMKTKWYTINYDVLDRFMDAWSRAGEPMANGYKSPEYKAFLLEWERSGDIARPPGQIDLVDRSNQPDASGQIDLSNNSIEPIETSVPFIAAGNDGEPLAHTGKEEDTVEQQLWYELQDHNLEEAKNYLATSRGNAPDDILSHPLTILFRKYAKWNKPLTKQMLNALVNDIEIPSESGCNVLDKFRGGLISCWNDLPGFENLCQERIPQFLLAYPDKPVNVLLHLRKFNKTDGKMKGFYTWRDEHPELCKVVETEEAKNTQLGLLYTLGDDGEWLYLDPEDEVWKKRADLSESGKRRMLA